LYSLPLPPTALAPLFPYTTLFRSTSHAATSQGRTLRRGTLDFEEEPGSPIRPGFHLELRAHGLRELAADREPQAGAGEVVAPARARKSTRLNSSHGSISYAVFCLK